MSTYSSALILFQHDCCVSLGVTGSPLLRVAIIAADVRIMSFRATRVDLVDLAGLLKERILRGEQGPVHRTLGVMQAGGGFAAAFLPAMVVTAACASQQASLLEMALMPVPLASKTWATLGIYAHLAVGLVFHLCIGRQLRRIGMIHPQCALESLRQLSHSLAW